LFSDSTETRISVDMPTVPLLGKDTARSFAGQRIQTKTAPRGGGGQFNWGNAMDMYPEEEFEKECKFNSDSAHFLFCPFNPPSPILLL